jgi:trk system potassium uptake protein TrkH
MHVKHIFKLIGVMLMFYSLSMLPPVVISLLFQENQHLFFLSCFAGIWLLGLVIWLICRKANKEIQIHDGFLLVVLFWALLCGFATLPFLLILKQPLSWIDVFFECVSGLTTTGVTIFTYPEILPKCLLYFRQQLQFLGGMSIIVLTVAIMPVLGVGGTRLYRTETPGALKDTKFTPRITQTAKALWSVYMLLTFSCMVCFKIAGMNWLDAVCEAFATTSTGGLAIHHDGMNFYQSPWIEWIAPVFMLLGSINFGTHYLALKKHNIKQYWEEEELRFFIGIILIAMMTACFVFFHHTQNFSLLKLRQVFFTVVSLISSTGSVCTDYNNWPLGILFMLLLLSLFGGCHGSTAGGIKIIRVLILSKFYRREMKILLHPQLISPIKYNNKPLDNAILFSMFSFIMTFVALYACLIFLMLLSGNDFITAIAIVTGTLSNSGIGFGDTAISFEHINTMSKVLAIIAMIAGRLEIFSLFIVFSLGFWKE